MKGEKSSRELFVRDGNGTYRPATSCELYAAVRRSIAQRFRRGRTLATPTDAKALFVVRLAPKPHEVFAALFLDGRHRVLAYEELFTGTIDGAAVHPREIARRALELNAAAVIFAHNHPSGVAEPSAADGQLTKRLKQALELFDVRVLDHIIVGDGDQTVSLAERGLF